MMMTMTMTMMIMKTSVFVCRPLNCEWRAVLGCVCMCVYVCDFNMAWLMVLFQLVNLSIYSATAAAAAAQHTRRTYHIYIHAPTIPQHVQSTLHGTTIYLHIINTTSFLLYSLSSSPSPSFSSSSPSSYCDCNCSFCNSVQLQMYIRREGGAEGQSKVYIYICTLYTLHYTLHYTAQVSKQVSKL